MILYNPTKSNLSVNIFGTDYLLEGEKDIRLKDEVAQYWITNIHQFLEVRSEKATKEIVAEVEEVKEVEEKPKAVSKKTK